VDIMELFCVSDLLGLMFHLNRAPCACERIRLQHGAAANLDEGRFQALIGTLKGTQDLLQRIGFRDAQAKVAVTLLYLERSAPVDVSSLETEIRNAYESLLYNSYKYQFVQIQEDRVKYLVTEFPFGKAVADAFPSAVIDIREATDCFAMERNPAAVHHLMRAAEIGLRALAKDRRITFEKGPIELQQWGDILGKLRKAIAEIENWPRSLAKEAAHQFYNKALLDLRSFNDAYRRHIAHARDHVYDGYEAESVMHHVSSFMQELATKISEKKRTPLVWKRP
jgi:hypothetical protein